MAAAQLLTTELDAGSVSESESETETEELDGEASQAPAAAAEGLDPAEEGEAADAEETKEVEEPKVDFSNRTLGRACMYGARGEVIYRPKGGRCRGD